MFDGFEAYALILTVGVALHQLLRPVQYSQIPAYAGAAYSSPDECSRSGQALQYGFLDYGICSADRLQDCSYFFLPKTEVIDLIFL